MELSLKLYNTHYKNISKLAVNLFSFLFSRCSEQTGGYQPPLGLHIHRDSILEQQSALREQHPDSVVVRCLRDEQQHARPDGRRTRCTGLCTTR